MIPKSLGGRLTCELLCIACNSRLGHDLEADAKHDRTIIIAANRLAQAIPNVVTPILESHPHIATDAIGSKSGFVRDGHFIVDAHKLADGSLIQPTHIARGSITRILEKNGFEGAPIREALETFDSGPEDEKIVISPELNVVKWRIKEVVPDLDKTSIMNPLIPIKTAFEFLACHLGRAIYNDNPSLDEIRVCLQTMIIPETIKVERLHSIEIKPFHGICFDGNNPHATVQIRLFGHLVFRVHFLRLAVGGHRFAYIHSLDTNDEQLVQMD